MKWLPKTSQNSVVKRLKTSRSRSRLTDDGDSKKLWLDLSYSGKEGEQLVTSLIKKLKRYFIENVSIVQNKYRTNKSSLFYPTKDRVCWNQKANVINIIQCPG